jgi:hypothetical protein
VDLELTMLPPRQSPRPLVAFAVLALLSSGCSSAELAGNDSGQGFEAAGGDGDGDGDGDTETGPTGNEASEESDTGETGEEDPMPEGIDDPGLELGSCDPEVEQVITHDLEEAQAEAAAVLVREHVLNGPGEVPNIPLSPQPFLNHFEFNYPPVEGTELQIAGELWKPPMVNADAPPRYRLQYALRGPAMSAEQRTPLDLVIVVDLGPAMAGEPLDLATEALAVIETALVPGDRVTLIGAAAEPELLGTSTIVDGIGIGLLTGALDVQDPAAVGNVGAALELAYETVTPYWEGQGQPRVLLISNGHFPFDDELVQLVEDHAVDGRHLVALGLGAPEDFAEASLRQLAAEGRGPLLYQRTADELWTDFQQRFTEHMVAVAIDVEVTLSLPPGLAIRERDQLAAKLGAPELALLGPNDAIVFHHELEACAELDPNALVRVEVEWTDPATNEAKLTVWEQPFGQLGYGTWATRKGAATVAYARALRGYRDGQPPTESFAAVLDAISLIAECLEEQPEDPDLVEMSQVLGKLEG